MKRLKFALKTLLLIPIILSCTLIFFFASHVHLDRYYRISALNRTELRMNRNVPLTDPVGKRMETNSTRAAHSRPDVPFSRKVIPSHPMFTDLTETWQPVDKTSNAHYVFSAYFHKTESKPTIRIIGAICYVAMQSPIYCKLQYRDISGRESIVSVKGSGRPLPEGHGFKYRVGLFHCQLPDDRIPVSVSVTTHPNTTAINKLAVKNQSISQRDKTFAVCASPLFGEYNNTHELIQWIELNRILGAELFVFYPYSVGKDVEKVLKFYSDKGIAQIIPWDVSKFRPPGQKQELFYVGQHAALNDCLMRLKSVSQFVVNSDLDEVIVPHSGFTTWHDIVKKSPDLSVYMFQSSFFRLNWNKSDVQFQRKDIAEKFELTYLLKPYREVKIFPRNDRTKYIAKTDAAEILGIHVVFEAKPGRKSGHLPSDTALIHHYRLIYTKIRNISVPDSVSNVPRAIDETVSRKYGEKLIDNVLEIYKELNHYADTPMQNRTFFYGA